MSNSYYTFTPRFVPGTKVRAGAVNAQFDLLEDAFDLLPADPDSLLLGVSTLGIESGSGNAYVVAMPNTRTANTEGDEVVFKATHQNSGAGTLQIDAVPAVSLVRWDGTALQSGDILSGSYYTARYDATNTRFMVVAPAQATVVGVLSYATPTGKAKLAASAGSAATVIRSDADIAIDVTVSPTWSGQHTFSQPVLGAAGTALLPSFAFSGDPNTGLYNIGADALSVTTGGVVRFTVTSTEVTAFKQFQGVAGLASAPTYSFTADPDTGLYSVAANFGGLAAGGSTAMLWGAAGIFVGPNGTAAAPSMSWNNDPDTGFYNVGANDLGIATGGTLRVDISTTAVTSTLPFLASAGSATAPTWSFSGDSNTGAYNVGADDWGVTTGGTLRFDISTTVVTSTLPLLANAGSASAPSHSFSGDSNTGMYSVSADFGGLTAGGSAAMFWSAAGIYAAPAGSGATPSISWNGDPDTGLYSVAANFGGLAAGGSTAMLWGAAGIFVGPDGAAATPSMSWNSDPDTGIYRSAANTMNFSVGGTQIASFNNTAGSMIVALGGSAGNITLDTTNGLSLTGQSTATTATAGANTLPANPVGFIGLNINGTFRKIPYYAN